LMTVRDSETPNCAEISAENNTPEIDRSWIVLVSMEPASMLVPDFPKFPHMPLHLRSFFNHF
jgi:hypothetical protein